MCQATEDNSVHAICTACRKKAKAYIPHDDTLSWNSMNYLICIHRSGYNLHSSQTHHWLQKRSFRGSVLCQNLPGGEVWSYGRSNSDVQQKMLKRLEEYEEASSLGGWSPETLRWIFGTRFRGW